MEDVWNGLLDHFEARADYFRIFDRYRMRPDSWLQVEALATLLPLAGSRIRDLRPDHHGCDVWLATADGEWWLMVQSLLTSYAGAGRDARPTVISVEQVAREMDKLSGLAMLSGGRGALLLAAFPFGPEPRERDEWKSQLLRFEAKGFALSGLRTVSLRPERECRIYMFA
ncbi:MAG TPA: hypothetical protein VFC51_06475 [Chloroflexota bacterium]|nr:hypothetical protein [Chloroflexota bacterium]